MSPRLQKQVQLRKNRKLRQPAITRYPGVYIQETPEMVPSISGVDTSVTAFVGWAARGPIDRAQRVRSFQDFQNHFGGLDSRSFLGYAVQHFFANGGGNAYIVRLFGDDAVSASLTLGTTLTVTAASPGAWANDYRIETTTGSPDATRFSLAVIYQPSGQQAHTVERFDDLSVWETDPRFVKRIVNDASAYISIEMIGSHTKPPESTAATGFTTPGSDGAPLTPNEPAFENKLDPLAKDGGIYLLDQVDLFNILCVPAETSPTVVDSLQTFCQKRRAFLIVDSSKGASASTMSATNASMANADASNSALYYPWVEAADPLDENRARTFPPCGFVAGVYARTDGRRGVWKAPAGIQASISGALGTELSLSDAENEMLNPRGINCIRTFPRYGTLIWGSRTLRGADAPASEWKYVAVRRLALFIEESVMRGTQWVSFERNDDQLWTQIRLSVGDFLQGLFRQGAFQGSSPKEAYLVQCDRATTTASDITHGVVNILVGFAPLKPAEFVVIRIQQKAGHGSSGISRRGSKDSQLR
ncbi:phage tail sheath subtilisin-like domain-containing protein [Marinobacter sp. ATCH36]|uniref:phage tail sheath subtilisin-like domain-containing protein n=1 Tax=Marinobacter sp. ATCH36 TaxID=2945106 RepID=UPI0020219737|nr:phage tail sheath subtilisin-like domain-containing protein [Marinobacter sp. ATCH36]MCL7945447.1 phage tail sheath subtilisin-like domain-containing protein [Marinobacter sp. ATCH36]